MSFLKKIKETIVGKPVTGVAIISDVEEVEKFLEEIVDNTLAKKANNKNKEASEQKE
jgi:hypothetical protein